MTQVVAFVCEHGAAKSIVAAAWLRRMAAQAGLDLRVVAYGTHPDAELSTAAVNGLRADGLTPNERFPEAVRVGDLDKAWHVISFDAELPANLTTLGAIPHQTWRVPAVSDGYEAARDAILDRLRELIRETNDLREEFTDCD